MNKYHAKKTKMDGYTFDSLRECARYNQLKLLAQSGEIAHLIVHPQWELQPAFRYHGKYYASIKYTPDFCYQIDGVTVVEDVKSKPTQTTAYRMQKRLFLFRYGDAYEFREVM